MINTSIKILRQQRGFNLIELMVGLAIGMFITVGLLTVFYNTRTTLTDQSGLSQLQQKQQLTAAVLSGVIQNAGTFAPDMSKEIKPLSFVMDFLADSFAAKGVYSSAAVIYGTDNQVQVRFISLTGAGMLDCLGNTNVSGVNQTVDNKFFVNANPDDSNGRNALFCTTGVANGVGSSVGAPTTTTRALVNGVQSLGVMYGVDTTNNNITSQYVTAANVTDWTAVRSVQITLTYDNPLCLVPNTTTLVCPAGQPQTITTRQLIRLMANTWKL
jgi:type IV pilus assembly protein PilW